MFTAMLRSEKMRRLKERPKRKSFFPFLRKKSRESRMKRLLRRLLRRLMTTLTRRPYTQTPSLTLLPRRKSPRRRLRSLRKRFPTSAMSPQARRDSTRR